MDNRVPCTRCRLHTDYRTHEPARLKQEEESGTRLIARKKENNLKEDDLIL